MVRAVAVNVVLSGLASEVVEGLYFSGLPAVRRVLVGVAIALGFFLLLERTFLDERIARKVSRWFG